jgi:hypothetical protein
MQPSVLPSKVRSVGLFGFLARAGDLLGDRVVVASIF